MNYTTQNFEALAEAIDFDTLTIPEMPERNDAHAALKTAVRSFQDAQKARLAQGNRVIQAAMQAAGLDPLSKQEEDEKRGAELAEKLYEDYLFIKQPLLDMAANAPAGGKKAWAPIRRAGLAGVRADTLGMALAQHKTPHGLLSRYSEFAVCAMMENMKALEDAAAKPVEILLGDMAVWTDWLADVKGAGAILAGAVLAEIDITKAQYPSSLWKYAGYDVAHDGRGRSRKAEHLEEVDYIDKEGNKSRRKGITFNPALKTKLYVLGSSFMKVGPDKSPYAKVYYDAKHRLEHHPKYGIAAQEAYDAAPKDAKPEYRPSKAHRHNMAMRAMSKRFLVDLYKHWRAAEGLPVAPEYSDAKLGLKHGSADKYR